MGTCSRNQKGFSLTELLIAVGIVSVLTVVGYGQYNQYRARAIQGEAKVEMSMIWSRAQTFRARYYQYFGDWRNLAYQANGDLNFRIGFWANAGGASNPAPPNYRGPGAAAGTNATNTNSGNACGAACSETSNACFVDASCVWTDSTIVVCAGFRSEENLSGRTTAQRKILRMNEGKNFIAPLYVANCK